MSFEALTREELVSMLKDVLARGKHHSEAQQGCLDPQAGLVNELRAYQIELEMQNRALRETQRELERSRDRYAELYDFAPVAFFTLDERFVIQALNFRAASLLQRSRERLLGRSFVEVAAPREPQALTALFARARENALGASGELVLEIAGEALHVQSIVTSSLHPRTRAPEFRCALVNVSARVRAEVERDRAYARERTLHERFEALDRINVAFSNILATHERTSVIAVLDALAEHALELLDVQKAVITLHGDVPLSVMRERAESDAAKRRGAAVELAVPLQLANRSLGQLTVVARAPHYASIAELRRTLELLAERAVLAVEIARINLTEADERARLTLLDRVAQELAGCGDLPAAETALAAILPDLVPGFATAAALFVRDGDAHRLVGAVHPHSEVQQRIERSADTIAAQLWRLVEEHRRTVVRDASELVGDGAELASLGLECVSVVPLIARQQTLGFLALGYAKELRRDALRMREVVEQIAERCASAIDTARLLDQLRTAVASRDTLLAIVSHDLRSPLNAILLTAGSLTPVPPHRERRRAGAQVELIRRSVARMSTLIDDLLTASSIDSGKLSVEPAAYSAHELVREACLMNEPHAAANAVRLEPVLPALLPEVWADRSRILQVLTNLLGNAIKFSPPQSVLRVTAEPHGEGVRFGVIDRGPGIAPQQLKQVFERYWTGKARRDGLGLGLFISERIVLAHGGSIWAESTLGQGAAFYFTLPLAAERAFDAGERISTVCEREVSARGRVN